MLMCVNRTTYVGKILLDYGLIETNRLLKLDFLHVHVYIHVDAEVLHIILNMAIFNIRDKVTLHDTNPKAVTVKRNVGLGPTYVDIYISTVRCLTNKGRKRRKNLLC